MTEIPKCPKCGSEYTYFDGSLYVCPDCSHEFDSVVEEVEADELKEYFPEFAIYEGKCRFRGCVHENEPDCAVKEAVREGKIAGERYEDYRLLYKELKAVKKWKRLIE